MLFLLFQLGPDRYAIPAGEIVEVLPLVERKVLPGAPGGIAGLIDYRGNATPLIDLSELALGKPAAERVSTRILMVRYPDDRGGKRLLGLIAERATETLSCDPADFVPTGVSHGQKPYLGPVRTDSRGIIQRIGVESLLDDALRALLFPEAGVAPP